MTHGVQQHELEILVHRHVVANVDRVTSLWFPLFSLA
jgi:hypothetical protein